MVFKSRSILVLGMKVASALKGLKQCEKVAKRLRALATIDDCRQCTGNIMMIIGDGGQCGANSPATIGCQHNFG